MTLQQLYRLLKHGRKQLRAVDSACSKVVPFEVSTIPFNELVQIELAKIDATESAIKAFFNRLRLLANKNARVIALKAVFSALLSKNTHQKTPIQSASNRILFSHFSRDNTSQIDSTAQ